MFLSPDTVPLLMGSLSAQIEKTHVKFTNEVKTPPVTNIKIAFRQPHLKKERMHTQKVLHLTLNFRYPNVNDARCRACGLIVQVKSTVSGLLVLAI